MKRTFDIVLFMPQLNIGGVQRVFITLANEWCRKGKRVCVLVLSEEGTLRRDISEGITIVNFKRTRLRQCFFQLVSFFNDTDIKFFVSAKDGINIFSVIAKMFAKKSKAKLVLTQHNFSMLEDNTNTYFYRKAFPVAMRLFYRKADLVIGVSKGILDYVSQLGVSAGKSCCIYNPINVSEVLQKAEEPIEIKDRFIMFCGRFSTIKNIPLLLKSYALLLKERDDVKLVLVGDGEQRQTIINLIQTLRLENRVVIISPTPNPYRFMKKAACVVISSYSEAFPMIAVESMLLGTTVVTTPNRGAVEITEGGLSYVSSSFDNERSFKDAICSALDNPIDSKSLIDRSMKLSVESIAKEYLDAFDKIVLL